MIDTDRLQVLIWIQRALLGETVPSLYAVTFMMSKPSLYVYWYIDSDITDEIEDHYYGFVAALYDEIPDDFWSDGYLHHEINICLNESELLGTVVYLRRTDNTVLFNSSVMLMDNFVTSCKRTEHQFQVCTLSSENILYHDFVSGDDYFVNKYIWLKDNNLSLVYPMRPKIANDILQEKYIYKALIPSTSSASAHWLLTRTKISVVLQKMLLGTIVPAIHQVWVKGTTYKLEVVLYVDDLTNTEVESSQRCISAQLYAEFPDSETSCSLEYADRNEVIEIHDPWFPVHLAPKT